MKIISIGRNPDNDIVINDNMISRRHAVIRVLPLGKYEIVSSGSNGTKVNGNQIMPNQPYPLKRGDSVTFANVANLNWKKVPNSMLPYQYGAAGLLAIIVIVCAIIFIPMFFSGWSTPSGGRMVSGGQSSGVTAPDSLNRKEKDKNDKMVELPDFQFQKTPPKKKNRMKDLKDVNGKPVTEVVVQEQQTVETQPDNSVTPKSGNADDDENISSRY